MKYVMKKRVLWKALTFLCFYVKVQYKAYSIFGIEDVKNITYSIMTQSIKKVIQQKSLMVFVLFKKHFISNCIFCIRFMDKRRAPIYA